MGDSAPVDSPNAGSDSAGVVAAAVAKPRVMSRRSDFLAANRGIRVSRPGFVLLARDNRGADNSGPDGENPQRSDLGLRFGITVTKRIGNAVVRNRMKRRFRALLRELLPTLGLPHHDHVLIGREGGVERDFAQLRTELIAAFERARAGKGDPPRGPRGKGGGKGGGTGGGKGKPKGRGRADTARQSANSLSGANPLSGARP